MFENSVSKPGKSNDIRWIEHRYCTKQIILLNYDTFIAGLQSFAHTDSHDLKQNETTCENLQSLLYLVLHFDILTLMKVWSLHVQ